MSTSSDFKILCRKRLKFLESDYEFAVTRIEEDRYGVFITYQNSTSFVRVSYEPRETGVSVFIGRTVGGKVPPYPIDVNPDAVPNWFDFNDLLVLMDQRPVFLPVTAKNQVSHEQLNKTLEEIARGLKIYATEIFRGDFSIFKQLDRVVRERASRMD